jgi:hypothetical protein
LQWGHSLVLGLKVREKKRYEEHMDCRESYTVCSNISGQTEEHLHVGVSDMDNTVAAYTIVVQRDTKRLT